MELHYGRSRVAASLRDGVTVSRCAAPWQSSLSKVGLIARAMPSMVALDPDTSHCRVSFTNDAIFHLPRYRARVGVSIPPTLATRGEKTRSSAGKGNPERPARAPIGRRRSLYLLIYLPISLRGNSFGDNVSRNDESVPNV